MKQALSFLLSLSIATSLAAQQYQPNAAPGEQGSKNVKVIGHIGALNASGPYNVSDVEVEQELSRPYVYLDRANEVSDPNPTIGFDIISIKDPSKPTYIYSWRIENPELHKGPGSLAPAYVKTKGRYYFFNGFQFRGSGPDRDLGGIVWDVTGLPDTSKIKEVARLRVPEHPGGFHETFAYKHSNGQALVIAQTVSAEAYIYDVDKIAAGDPNPVVGKVAIPNAKEVTYRPNPAWHDFYVGFDPVSQQDRFYGAGAGGGFVIDITNVAEPKLLASATNLAGVTGQHTFTPTPDGRYALIMPLVEDWYAPAKIVDLKPSLDGTVATVSRPIGAWNASPQGIPHYSEVRWPYVFFAGQSDGFHVVNMMDPTNPYTVGYYATRPGPYMHGVAIAGYEQKYANRRGNSAYEGAWGIDVRNNDGLIVISDFDSGLWLFRMDGFSGWNGHQWGVPNVSSVQDWDNGPDGAKKTGKVS